MPQGDLFPEISFKDVIANFNKLQKDVLDQIKHLASKTSTASPAKFLLAQFGMSQLTQIGGSISNLIAQVNSAINTSVRNQKST